MTKRALPPTGGGAPIILHSAISTPSTDGQPRTSLTTRLTVSAEAQAAGRSVVDLVRNACDADDLDAVAILRFFFDSVTERVPEFHALMDALVATGDLAAVDRIMREPGAPGRPRGDFFVVALIEQVMAERSLTAKGAAIWLAKPGNVEWSEGRRYLPAEKRMQNLHSEFKNVFALWRQSLCVDPALLTPRPWRPPGYVSPLDKYITTPLSNGVVFHLPENTVTEGTSNVEVVPSLEQQPRQPDEPEPLQLSQRPSGKRGEQAGD
jgi:hypothetical protein